LQLQDHLFESRTAAKSVQSTPLSTEPESPQYLMTFGEEEFSETMLKAAESFLA
jgi:hypothetical protein